jgi:hypothetical protein
LILPANAALSRRQRERLVRLVCAGATITAAAVVVGCSRQTASKWVGRDRRGEGLAAARLPRDAIVLYERERPGELLHVDVKKLGRIVKPSHRDELDPANDHYREVYARYGLAMYCTQVLEHELVNFVVVSGSMAGKFTTVEERDAFDEALFGSTMGRQLRHALAESRFDDDQVKALEQALQARNFLAHERDLDVGRILSPPTKTKPPAPPSTAPACNKRSTSPARSASTCCSSTASTA